MHGLEREIPTLTDKIMRVREDDPHWYGVIAGNKIDLEDARQISKEEGQIFVNERNEWFAKNNVFPNLKFFETSAKQKINVEMVFHECVRWVTNGKY